MSNVDRYLQGIKPEDITKQEGNFSLALYFSLLPECYAPYFTRYYDFNFGAFLFICKPHHGTLFFNMASYVRTAKETYNKLQNGDIESLQEVKDYRTVEREIEDLYNKNGRLDLNNVEQNRLVSDIDIYYQKFFSLLSSTIFSEAVYEDLVKDLYTEAGGDEGEFEEFLFMAAKPAFESFLLRQDRCILDYVADRDISRIAWTYTDYYFSLSDEEIESLTQSRVDDLGGVDGLKNYIAKVEAEVAENKKIVLEYASRLDGKLKNLFAFTQFAMEVRDVRKTSLQMILTLIAGTSKELCRRRAIALELAPYTIYSDWSDGKFMADDFEQELKKRMKCVVYFDAQGPVFEFDDPDQAWDKMDKATHVAADDNDVLKGNSACHGLASGIVKVVLSLKDFDKFESGDILVTSMTRPEFLPIMKKAAAIITDEGGITCHAAIVSRELNIPCVIGTKNASRSLKDGNRVEVDADHGIVKKIKD
ncbi:MAG TPA: PEP-utilizing enzyme [bacterium]|nr:PEP-utilizing enzyme [bacterium]